MKQRTRILIYILVAIAVVIMGSMAIINNRADKPLSAQDHIDLGHKYLIELSYDKAVIEFTEAIEIEPLNADAYLGLAEAYVGTGDTEKAIEILEEGYDITGDERLKDMLEELLPSEPEVTTAVTTAATTATATATEATTVSTALMTIVPDLSGLTEEEAIAACEAAGLKYSVSYDYSDEVEKGYVIGQTIPVNVSVAEGVSVPFVISDGNIVSEAITTVVTSVTFTEISLTTTNTSAIVTTVSQTTTVSESTENEKEYDDNGNLLYEKIYTDEGYELWWYYPAKKGNKAVIHVIEQYDNKDNLQYSTIYDISGEKYIEGKPIINENGYSITVVDNILTTEYKINDTRNVYEYITSAGGSYITEYYYDIMYEYIEKTKGYAADSSDVVFEEYYESKKDYEKQYSKKNITYLNGGPLTIIEYKTNSSDKARIEQHYLANGDLLSISEFDSNDVQRKFTQYSNNEKTIEFNYDENGNLILNFN